jgi:hypothetical protein
MRITADVTGGKTSPKLLIIINMEFQGMTLFGRYVFLHIVLRIRFILTKVVFKTGIIGFLVYLPAVVLLRRFLGHRLQDLKFIHQSVLDPRLALIERRACKPRCFTVNGRNENVMESLE